MSSHPFIRRRAGAGRTPAAVRLTPVLAAALLVGRPAAAQSRVVQTNLVSDVAGHAYVTDPQLVNPWGVSASPTGPFWVSDNHTGLSTLYNGAGVKQGLVVTVPGVGGAAGSPTGQVFNGTGSFALPNGGNAVFLFASEDGTISGWNPAGGASAVTAVNPLGGASYKGLAVSGSGAGARLYGANFGQGRVDVFDGSFGLVGSGGFVDPNLPAGYAPFNAQTIGNSVYVTYALHGANGDDVPGAGHGFLDVYGTDGTFQRRLVSGGALNSPWGMAIAPAGFGSFGGDLLVGNFGDGMIHAYDPLTGAAEGALLAADGTPLAIDGLWSLDFGNGGKGGASNALYFTAGPDDEAHGLFGSLTAVPEPSTFALAGLGVAGLAAGARRRRAPAA